MKRIALAIALLGGMESLLSAVVADGMTGRRHRSNCELVAQGWANIGSALFGGLCVTGTIARTATNIRAHAHGPVAGMMHAVFLLAFMMLAAPLANWIPLAALAAVLAVVAWNMVERDHIRAVMRGDRAEAAVLVATFLLTAFHDLTVGIGVGVAMGARGATAASQAADVVIVEDSIARLAHAIAIAKNSMRKATEAVSIGMGLSVVAMFAGAFGLINASQGALIQEGIDVIAILWALTALRSKI